MGSLDKDAEQIKTQESLGTTGTGRKVNSGGLGFLKGLNKHSATIEKLRAEEAKKKSVLSNEAQKKSVEHVEDRGTKSPQSPVNSLKGDAHDKATTLGSNKNSEVEGGKKSPQSPAKVPSDESTEVTSKSGQRSQSNLAGGTPEPNELRSKSPQSPASIEANFSANELSLIREEKAPSEVPPLSTVKVPSSANNEVTSTSYSIAEKDISVISDSKLEVTSKSPQSPVKVTSTLNTKVPSESGQQSNNSIKQEGLTYNPDVRSKSPRSPVTSEVTSKSPQIEVLHRDNVGDNNEVPSKSGHENSVPELEMMAKAFEEKLEMAASAPLNRPETSMHWSSKNNNDQSSVTAIQNLNESIIKDSLVASQEKKQGLTSSFTVAVKPITTVEKPTSLHAINLTELPVLTDEDLALIDEKSRINHPDFSTKNITVMSPQSPVKAPSEVASNLPQSQARGHFEVTSLSPQSPAEVTAEVTSKSKKKSLQIDWMAGPAESFGALSGTQLSVVKYLVEICQFSGTKKEGYLQTEYMTKKHFAEGSALKESTLDTAIDRLAKKRIVGRVAFKDGAGGGTSYGLSDVIYREAIFSRQLKMSGQNPVEVRSQVPSEVPASPSIQTNIQNNINIKESESKWWYAIDLTPLPGQITPSSLNPFYRLCAEKSLTPLEQGGLDREKVQDFIDRFPQFYAQQNHSKMANVPFAGYFFNRFKEFVDGNPAVLEYPTKKELEQKIAWAEKELQIQAELAKVIEADVLRKRNEALKEALSSFEAWFDSSTDEDKGQLVPKNKLHASMPNIYKEALRVAFMESLGFKSYT